MPHKENDQESFIKKVQQLQYTQLLEVHRTYFTLYLQVLAIYLAVMGGCLTVVATHIGKLKKNEADGSKTVLFALILFAIIASLLFGRGIIYGYYNAVERSSQIADVASQLSIIPINVELLQYLFFMMFFGVTAIIIIWVVMFVRGIMECVKKQE